MLKLYSSATRAESEAELCKSPLPEDVIWIDILKGTADEIRAVEQATGIMLPPFDSLWEIEHSSRMRRQGASIVVSLPLPSTTQGAALLPVGFILSQALLVTIRFDAEPAFEQFLTSLAAGEPADASAPSVMIGLMETMADRLADSLEETGDELDSMAGNIFGATAPSRDNPSPKLENATLRETIRRVGRIGQKLGKVRASLLAGGRIVPYLEAEGRDWFDEGTRSRLGTLRADIASLDEYESHLADKVQFLQDAAIGLINIEQNDSFKVLTIASVVGIPPTLVASMYGMNFHNMPELSWAWGYPYGLAAIAVSAAVPLLWFKVKGWF